MTTEQERQFDLNNARDWEYSSAVKMFYLIARAYQNATVWAKDDWDAIADATERGLKIKAFTKLHSMDVKRAREVGEKHAEMKAHKRRWLREGGYNDGVWYGDSSLTRTLNAKYGNPNNIFVSCARTGNGGYIPFVDATHKN